MSKRGHIIYAHVVTECCNRMLYRKTVRKFECVTYSRDIFTGIRSFDNKEYICHTCHLKAKKGKTPCQAVCNKLAVDEVPSELGSLRKLESVLVAQRLIFQKIIVMPKGQQKKIRGAICNVPVNCDTMCQSLPRPSELSGIILLKLKRKLQYTGHQYCEAVRPEFVKNALEVLKTNYIFYENVEIDMHNLEEDPIRLDNYSDIECDNSSQPYVDHKSNERSEKDHTITGLQGSSSNYCENEDENYDPQNQYRASVNETCLESFLPNYPVRVNKGNRNRSGDNSDDLLVAAGNEIFSIAPGEGKHPIHFMQDKHCEELAFPVLFPKGRFGYQVEREVKLSPTKYFNARLLNYTGRFAANAEYLFFAQYITEQKKVQDSINIALKKVSGQPLTASQVRNLDSGTMQHLIFSDQAYYFMKNITGSPAYWKNFLFDVVAMIKQLGPPAWWITFSCADLCWNEIYKILSKLKGHEMSDTEIEHMTYDEKCKMLNSNPVVVAKHFQYRLECLFRDVLLGSGDPIGKLLYHAIRIEFQFRGSPHAHCFVWIKDCPLLSDDTVEVFAKFIDKHVSAFLPDPVTCPVLHELVKTYQRHAHSKTCRKYKNLQCRFNFGHFFIETTIVARPLPKTMNEEERKRTLTQRHLTLTKVKQFIDHFLNPHDKSNYKGNMTIDEILSFLEITKREYYTYLATAGGDEYEIHLKHPPNSCFINNYNPVVLLAWQANMDIQPGFNHYRCVTYLCSYMSKGETQCSEAIRAAAKEARKENLNMKQSLRKIGAVFLSSREVSSQECVYRCLPELWLRKTFPGTIFINTGLPGERIRTMKSQEKIAELEDDSTDIFNSNIIDRYCDRPNTNFMNGIYSQVDEMCLAKFASHYYNQYHSREDEGNDNKPVVLSDDVIENQHHDCSRLPKRIKLMSRKETMKCRKVKAVI